MPWKEISLMSQRLEFIKMALKPGTNMTQLCKQYNISRTTGYKWLYRFVEGDIYGLDDRCRRPLHSPNKTMEQAVLGIRQLHSYWGGRKIKARLNHQGYKFVPAASTITAILRRNGLLDEENIRRLNGLNMINLINCGRWILKGIFLSVAVIVIL